MAMMDTQTTFSGGTDAAGNRFPQVITGNAISTGVLDRSGNLQLFPTVEDEGLVGGPWLVVQTADSFNNLSSLRIEVLSASNADLTQDVTVHATRDLQLAQLTANRMISAQTLPSDEYRRFIGLRYTVTGGNPSQGSVYAYMTFDLQKNVSYASGTSVY